VQRLALPAGEDARPRQGIDHMRLVRLGDRRKAHDVPILLRQHVADQIVLVQPVHDQDDGALILVLEAAVEGVVEPLVGGPPVGIGQGLLGFQRVVDDDDVGTPPSQHAADRGGEPAALGRGFELWCGLPLRREPGWEEVPVPVAGNDAPAIARELVGEVLGIADAEDLGARPMTETPGRKGDRSQVRLQVARRQVDDQPPRYLSMLKSLAQGGHGWKIGWKMLFTYRSCHPAPVDGSLVIARPHVFWPGFSGCIVPWW